MSVMSAHALPFTVPSRDGCYFSRQSGLAWNLCQNCEQLCVAVGRNAELCCLAGAGEGVISVEASTTCYVWQIPAQTLHTNYVSTLKLTGCPHYERRPYQSLMHMSRQAVGLSSKVMWNSGESSDRYQI